jgi:hypothetical protein
LRRAQMPYFWGVLSGILLTIVVVFVIDNIGDKPGTPDIVNWDYVGVQLGETAEKVGEEVRQEVHDATAPEPGADTTPADSSEPGTDTTPADPGEPQ